MNNHVNKHVPYPGLRPYREDEQANFFGRESDCKVLIDKILVNRLTLLFSATGVGKSSLLQAGVLPALKSPHGENLDVIYCNDWISNPLDGLKQAVKQALQDSGSWRKEISYQLPVAEKLTDFFGFCVLFTCQPLVVVLDQFEEFFRYQKGRPIFEVFLEQLTGVFSQPGLPVHLVFSMREDFALELDAFKKFVPLSVFDNLYRLEKLGRETARAAVLAPLRPTGFEYEPALLEQLLTDLLSRELRRDGNNPLASLTESVEPPYLQIVCSQLWEREQGNTDRVLHLKTYQAAGGAKGLLENYIQKVLKAFSERDKALASRAFDYLISRHGAKTPYIPEDLAAAVSAQQTELEAVLEKLTKARILRSQNREEKIWYELYHDMFAGSIEGWNSKQKEKMRNRRLLIGGSAALLAALSVYFGTIAYVHSTSHHLRLAPGDDNRVEVFTGKQGWADPFGQQVFYRETELSSREMEADKRFTQKGLLDYAVVNTDLIDTRLLEDRVIAYVRDGNYFKALKLFEITTKSGNNRQANTVVRGLSRLKIDQGFKMLQDLAASEKNADINQIALVLVPENSTSLPWTDLTRFRIDQQRLEYVLHSPAILNHIHVSPLLFQKLLDYLKDPKPNIRAGASEALGLIGDRAALDGLLRALADDNSGVVRIKAAEALGLIGDRAALDGLLRALADDKSGVVRIKAAEALGRIGDNAARDSLLRALADDKSGVVRAKAAEALGRIGDNAARDSLLDVLVNDKENVRASAAVALGQIGDRAALDGLLKALADDSAAGVRSSAVSALGEIGDSAAVGGLLKVLADDDSAALRAQAALALGQIGDGSTLDDLRKRLDDDDAKVRAQAAYALGRIGDSAAVDELINSLTDEDQDVRANAADALGQIGDRAARNGLFKAMDDDNANVRASAAEALGQIGDSTILDGLRKKLDDDNANVRASAAEALGEIGDGTTVEGLLNVLADDSAALRASAAEALGEIGDSVAVEGLLKLLIDDDRDVRAQAAYALGRIGDSAVVDELLSALADDNENVRYTAASALGQIKNPVAPTYSRGKSDVTQKYSWGDFFDHNDLSNVYGSAERRHQLLNALNLPTSHERDQQLLDLVQQPDLHLTIKEKAITVLGEKGTDKQQLITALQALTPTQAALKRAVKSAIEKLAGQKTEKLRDRLENLKQQAANGDIPAILNIVRQEEESDLSNLAYRLLGDLGITSEIPLLKNRLEKLTQQYADWRKLRDSKTTSGSQKPEEYGQFLPEVRAAKAKINPNAAFDYAYALSRLDPEFGLQLLRHPLADARQGAYTAFMMKANIEWLAKLDQAREQHRDDPIFRHAAFRAIDLGLWRLEVLGNKDNDNQELRELEAWHDTIKTRKMPEGDMDDEVLERLEWTILMMKHTNEMTAQFAKDNWVRDWPENALPVNQPYPDL